MIQRNLKDVHGIEMFFYLVHNCIKKRNPILDRESKYWVFSFKWVERSESKKDKRDFKLKRSLKTCE